jgi:hypothetical protein
LLPNAGAPPATGRSEATGRAKTQLSYAAKQIAIDSIDHATQQTKPVPPQHSENTGKTQLATRREKAEN